MAAQEQKKAALPHDCLSLADTRSVMWHHAPACMRIGTDAPSGTQIDLAPLQHEPLEAIT